jgi:hypothetical protein
MPRACRSNRRTPSVPPRPGAAAWWRPAASCPAPRRHGRAAARGRPAPPAAAGGCAGAGAALRPKPAICHVENGMGPERNCDWIGGWSPYAVAGSRKRDWRHAMTPRRPPCFRASRRPVCRRALPGVRPGLARQADAHHGRRLARRRHRHPGAHAGRQDGAAVEAKRGGGEPPRRLEHHRRRPHGPCAPADGTTLLLATNTGQAIAPHLLKLKFDPLKDLQPVGLVAVMPNVLVVSSTSPYKSVKELTAAMIDKPAS